MTTSHDLAQQIHEAIEQAGGLYHRLVLAVGPTGAGKTAALRELAEGSAMKYRSGPVKVVVKMESLREALLVGGSPATLAELKRRYEDHLADLVKGKDPSRVRLVVG